MISTQRSLTFAVRTTAIAVTIVLLGADLASACHKRRARVMMPTAMAHGCATAPVGHTVHSGFAGSGGYIAQPMPSHQGAFGVGTSPYATMPAQTGYGMGPGMGGQAITGPGRFMGGIGQGMTRGFGARGMGVGTFRPYGGMMTPGQMGTFGPGMGGGYGPGFGY